MEPVPADLERSQGPHYLSPRKRNRPFRLPHGLSPHADEVLEVIRSCKKMVLLTEGYSTSSYAKTAIQLLRYRRQDVVAVIDSDHSGSTVEELFGIGGQVPVVGSLGSAPGADSLFLGIAPPGGSLPGAWRTIIAGALRQGLNVVSGLHTNLTADPEFADAGRLGGARVVDVRGVGFYQAGEGRSFRPGCVRIHTVGTDCCVGKMSATKEIELELRRRGRDAAFIATGQTGMMISGGGIAIDGVVSDFVNGAAERLVAQHEHHELLLVEGQGSIAHPAYSGVTVGLLHGCAPDALVLCHEAGRESLKSAKHVPVWPLGALRELYEAVASARHPCRVIGVAINGRRLTPEQGEVVCRRVESDLGLPACDVYRDGASRLADAVEAFDKTHRERVGATEYEVVAR